MAARLCGPQAQFEKWGLFGSYSTAGGQWGWLSTFNAQWTPDRLYSVERLSLGGEASVRGFKEQSISGDVGGYLQKRAELARRYAGLARSMAHLAGTGYGAGGHGQSG